MKPYYQDDACTIYHGDCREILPGLPLFDPLLITDPPYGVSEATNRKERGRGNLAECNDFPPVFGDDEPFDPSHLLALNCRMVLFGGNYYADKLPSVPSWIVWDKRDGVTSNDNADCELAWTNAGGPARVYRHLWNGMLKDSERNQRRVHPTQKPVALMAWIIDRFPAHMEIVDPYMGGGSTLVAAKAANRKSIGIEIEERYCEIAARRLAQEVLAL